jgi:hypothetical protein
MKAPFPVAELPFPEMEAPFPVMKRSISGNEGFHFVLWKAKLQF